MRLEVPECRRCCCCVPLRRGILVFGYINLMFSICIVVMESVISFNEFNTTYMMAVYKGVSFYSQAWFALVLYSAEIVFNIVLLIGAHKKKTKLLRAYYYYGITTTLASLVTFVVVRHREIYGNWGYNIIECSIVFCGIGLQVYLLLLVRSELLKMRQSSRFCYVNHAAEMVVDTPLQTGRNPF